MKVLVLTLIVAASLIQAKEMFTIPLEYNPLDPPQLYQHAKSLRAGSSEESDAGMIFHRVILVRSTAFLYFFGVLYHREAGHTISVDIPILGHFFKST